MSAMLSLLLIALITVISGQLRPAFAISDVGQYYEVHHNTSMVSDAVIKELQTRTKFECVSECRFHCTCVAVNVRKSNTTRLRCTMFKVTSNDEDASLIEEPGASYIKVVLENEEDEDCKTLKEEGSTSSGVYSLARMNRKRITTFCDMQTGTGGWTMVQRRMDGSVDFYRGWQQYKEGFGNPEGEFWLGLDKIHELTKSGKEILRFDLWDDTGHRFAEYRDASVACEDGKYKLTFSSYSGTAGDAMTRVSNGRAFSTYDKDNDDHSNQHCAEKFQGGWWYGDCHEANLNGLYLNGSTTQHAVGMVWTPFRGYSYSLLRVEIKVKRM